MISLTMGAKFTSETKVTIYQTTWCQSPENHNLKPHLRDRLEYNLRYSLRRYKQDFERELFHIKGGMTFVLLHHFCTFDRLHLLHSVNMEEGVRVSDFFTGERLGSKPGFRGETPATNRPSRSAAGINSSGIMIQLQFSCQNPAAT
jgi:hypothetical protein